MLLAITQIFNRPGIGVFSQFNYLLTYPRSSNQLFNLANIFIKYPPGVYILLKSILDHFPLNSNIVLFYNQIPWIISKYSIFSAYILTWLTLLYFRTAQKVFKKISVLDLSVAYFASVSLLLASVSLSFFDVLAAPFFVLMLSFLYRKQFILAGIFFLLSVSFNWTLLIFLPVFFIFFIRSNKFRNLPLLAIVAFFVIPLSVLLGYLGLYIAKPVFYSNFPKFDLYNLHWIIYGPLRTILTGSPVRSVVFVAASAFSFIIFGCSVVYCLKNFFMKHLNLSIPKRLVLYLTLVVLFAVGLNFFKVSVFCVLLFFPIYTLLVLRLSKTRFMTTEVVITSMLSLYFLFIVFIPALSPGNFIWLILLGLISYILHPESYTKYQLILLNLLTFIGLFIFYGTASNEPVRGDYFSFFKSIFSAGFIAYSLWYVSTIYNLKLTLENSKKKLKEFLLKRNKVFIVVLLTLLNLSLIPSSGSPDHTQWNEYANMAVKYGPFKGQTMIEQHYPPLSTFIMGSFSSLGQLFTGPTMDHSIPIKISIFIFYCLTVYCLFVFTGNKKIGSLTGLDKILIILSTFSLILHTQALSEIDIYVIPFVILSIYLLFKKKILLSGLFLGLAVSIKWQPLILLPLFVAKLVDIKISKQNIRDLAVYLVGFAIIPLISWSLVFRYPLGMKAFDTAIAFIKNGMPLLSGQALNINWIITYLMHIFAKPGSGMETLGELGNLNRQIPTSAVPWILRGQLFKIAFVFIMLKYWLSKKKELITFLGSAVMIYFAHHQLNHSAYEKHLFYVVVFMLILFLNKPTALNRKLLILIDIITFVNMILFFSITGPRDFQALFYGFDLTVVFSLLYFIIFLWFFWGYARKNFLKT